MIKQDKIQQFREQAKDIFQKMKKKPMIISIIVGVSILVIGGVYLSSHSVKKLNTFEYADNSEQAAFLALVGGLDASSNDYVRLLKNNDIVYFDSQFEDDIVIKAKDDYEVLSKEILIGVYYDGFVETETTSFNYIDNIKEGSENVRKNLRKLGFDGNFIYVMRDANEDLVLRMTNGEVDYNYFDTTEAKKIYGNYIANK